MATGHWECIECENPASKPVRKNGEDYCKFCGTEWEPVWIPDEESEQN